MKPLNENIEEKKEIYELNETDTYSFKCEKCGSVMEFDAQTQKLRCTHCSCLTDFIKSGNVQELEFTPDIMEEKEWSKEATVFKCENCGAKEVLNDKETAKFCPFCGTSHIVKTSEMAGLKPNAIIPFTITQKDMHLKLKTFAKKKIFAPKSFKTELEVNKINGVYSPCFTFDSLTFSNYHGVLGKVYYVSVGSGKNRRTERRVRYFNVNGQISQAYDDVLIDANPSLKSNTVYNLLPFKKEEGQVYDKAYLSGFMANQYGKKIKDCFTEAKKEMDIDIKRKIMDRYDADVESSLNIFTDYNNVTYKYILLPVYVGNYTFRNKLYNFYANGNTGKIIGKTPVSPLKVSGLITFLAILGIIIYFLVK